MAEKYLLVTNEIENTSFGENLISLYQNFTDVQGKTMLHGGPCTVDSERHSQQALVRKN